jgi:hypothetical protein
MSEEKWDDFTKLWQSTKAHNQPHLLNLDSIRKARVATKKRTLATHYGNATVLAITVAVLVFYFYYLYNFQDLLSKVGYNLMIGGLSLRIVIEFFSVWRSKKIDVSETAASSLQHAVDFLEFRRRIHGPVTMVIFVLYFVGFYMLTPEFSRYLAAGWLLLIDGSAILVAVGLIFFIRKGNQQELRDLEKMVEMQQRLINEE